MNTILENNLCLDLRRFADRDNLQELIQINCTHNADGRVLMRDQTEHMSISLNSEWCNKHKEMHQQEQNQEGKQRCELMYEIQLFMHEDVGADNAKVNQNPNFVDDSRSLAHQWALAQHSFTTPDQLYCRRQNDPDDDEQIEFVQSSLKLSSEFQALALNQYPLFVFVCVPIIDRLRKPELAIRTEPFTVRSKVQDKTKVSKKTKYKRTTKEQKEIMNQLDDLDNEFLCLLEQKDEAEVDIEQDTMRLEEVQRFLDACQHDPLSKSISQRVKQVLYQMNPQTTQDGFCDPVSFARGVGKMSSSSSSSSSSFSSAVGPSAKKKRKFEKVYKDSDEESDTEALMKKYL